MSERMIEKLLGAAAGDTAIISPDHVLVTNGSSHAVTGYVKRAAAPEKVLVMYDHNVPSGSPEDAKVFGEILRFAKQYGFTFKQAKGIGLKYLADEIVRPGQIVITGTRHAGIFGAAGAVGFGISSTELARVIENDRYELIVPKTIGVKVTGTLPENTGMIDAALSFLAAHPDLKGKAVEFVGGDLSDHDKQVLCSMACETGAVTAFWTEEGETETVLDLAEVVPMLRMPCSDILHQTRAPFAPASYVEGRTIQAGQIGGVNGGAIEDLRIAAQMIEGKKLKLRFRLTVCPATSKDYILAAREGILTKFIDYGAQISAAGDHSIVKQGAGAMGHGELLLTTGMYTFAGCMGCDDATVATASVQTIIRASYGEI